MLAIGSAAPAWAQVVVADVPIVIEEIVVTTTPLFRALAERSLGEDDIAAYGMGAVEELIGEVLRQTGNQDEPVYLLNGKPVNNLNEIARLPPEALQRVEVLPPGAGAELGYAPDRRVISITLKAEFIAAVVAMAGQTATDGGWRSVNSQIGFSRIKGDQHFNVNVSVNDEVSLLESDRGIVQPVQRFPYSLDGNIIPDPRASFTEIDPALSALAGRAVTVAAVPSATQPTLASIATSANAPSLTDLGAFRTLRPETRNYDFNVAYARPLASWLRSSINARIGYSESKSLNGLVPGLLVLRSSNTASPFSRDVGIAAYGDALDRRSRRLNANANLNLNATFGKWQMNFGANYQQSFNRTTTERENTQQGLVPILIDDRVNPFAEDLGDLLPLRIDRTRSRNSTLNIQDMLSGPAFKLPAGPVRLTIEGRYSRTSQSSRNSISGNETSTGFARIETSVRGAVNAPITSRRENFLKFFGNFGVNAGYSRAGFSNSAAVNRYNYGFNWEPRERIFINGGFSSSRQPPPVQTLSAPITITPGVRIFDILRNETVDVTEITGGNPALLPQTNKSTRFNASYQPIRGFDWRLNVDYSVNTTNNLTANLPLESAPIWLAFPERFTRDASGRLTAIDRRSVNFERQRQRRLSYGFNLSLPIGDATGAPSAGPTNLLEAVGGPRPAGPPNRMRLQMSVNHGITLSNRIDIRAGVPPVDLLAGGATGIGGGGNIIIADGPGFPGGGGPPPGAIIIQSGDGAGRHQLDFSVGLNDRGWGVSLLGIHRGASVLQVRSTAGTDFLTFAPVTTLSLGGFIESQRLFPQTAWLKGTRLTLRVSNLTGARQRVTDSAGATPLRYQPGYRDPLGRTVHLGVQKRF